MNIDPQFVMNYKNIYGLNRYVSYMVNADNKC